MRARSKHRPPILSERRVAVNALAAIVAAGLFLPSCVTRSEPNQDSSRGRNALEEGRFDLARRYLESATTDRPEDPELCTLFARSWSSGTMQNPVKAIEAWERCREIAPSLEAAIEIARGHLRLGAYADAVAALDGVKASAEASVLRGEALLHLDLERTAEEIAAAVERFPDHAPLRKLASRAAHLREDFETAQRHLTRALELDPLDGRMHYLAGRTRQQLGDSDGAAKPFERHELVSRLTGSGGWSEATTLEKLRLLDQLAVKTPNLDVLRIEWLRAVGRGHEALELAEQLLQNATATTPNLLRAEVEVAGLGRFELAHQLLERARRDDSDPKIDREVRYRLAQLFHQQDDPQGALAEIEHVLATAPWAARFLDLRARVEMSAGNDDDAAKDLELVLALAPWRIDSRLALAEIELRRGHQARAEDLLSGAPEASPAISEFRRRHGLS